MNCPVYLKKNKTKTSSCLGTGESIRSVGRGLTLPEMNVTFEGHITKTFRLMGNLVLQTI